MLPVDTLSVLDDDRGEKVQVTRKTRMDWQKLRTKVSEGMRNATLMAIAPTANIAHIAGTTPGIDPQFSQIFSRSTLNGKFLEINPNLVKDLKELGIWEEVKDELLINQGNIQSIEAIPESLKKVYKTSLSCLRTPSSK